MLTAMTEEDWTIVLRVFAERWSRLAGQNGGLAKVDSGFDYAANLSLFACVA